MFHLYGYEEAIRSVYKACNTPAKSGSITNIEELRHCYLDFLERSQSAKPNRTPDQFILGADVEARLSEFFSRTDPGDRMQRRVMGRAYPPEVRQTRMELARKALDGLLSLDDDLRAVFELVIHSIIIRAHAETVNCHGGSSSCAIGVIWLSVDSSLQESDLMELFLHELTHHLLYIDELNNPQFMYDEMFAEENFVSSAILRKSKSVSKVVHSMIVGVELCLWRQRSCWTRGPTLVHPNSTELLAGIRHSHESITALKRFNALTTAHLRSILDRAMCQCQILDDDLRAKRTRSFSDTPIMQQ